MTPPGLQHPLPSPGALPQLRGLRGPRGEDPQRRQRVGQLPHPGLPGLPQEAHDRLERPEVRRCTFTPSGSTQASRRVSCFWCFFAVEFIQLNLYSPLYCL